MHQESPEPDFESEEWDISIEDEFNYCSSILSKVDKSYLIECTQKHLALELKTRKIRVLLTNEDKSQIESYLKKGLREGVIESSTLLTELEYLASVSKDFSNLIQLDSIVMEKLSKLEPDVYERVLAHRKKCSVYVPSFHCKRLQKHTSPMLLLR